MKNMMKKGIALVLALTLVFTLAGCDSMDYKKATKLYQEGSYEEAKAIFVELGDYEDSAEMAMACSYAMAEELMEDEEYEAAAEIFLELGGYEDSEELGNECLYTVALQCMEDGDFEKAQELFAGLGDYEDAANYAANMNAYILAAYLQENGSQTYENVETQYTVTLAVRDKDTFELNYRFDGSGDGFGMYQDVTLVFDIGSTEATVTGEGYISILSAYMEDSGDSTLDISTYVNGDAITWNNYKITGKKVDGKPLDSTATGVLMMSGANTASLNRMASGVNTILADLAAAGLIPEMTVADIGFTSYE